MKIALETITLKKGMNGRALATALFHAKSLGITALEIGKIPLDDETVHVLYQSGLSVTSIMAGLPTFEKDFHDIVAYARLLHCHLLVVSMLAPSAIVGGDRALSRFIQRMNRLSDALKGTGMTLAYHHHAWEFVKHRQGTKMDRLLADLSPDIRLVCDVYWTAVSGISPADFITALGPRLIGLHVRDLAYRTSRTRVIPYGCPVGQGTLDWKGIMAAAQNAEYAAIELKTDDPWTAIEQSLNTLEPWVGEKG